MANVYVTLADLVKLNDLNLGPEEVSDLLDDAPLLAALAAGEASNGTDHKYLKETGAPVVGFRAVNDGRENDASEDTLVTINLKIFDASFAIDKAVADAFQKGGPQALIAREAKRHLKAAFFGAESQLIYGTDEDALGFVGLAEATTVDALADEMVTDAGGTTADTASSVWLIRTNDDADCKLIAGNEGKITVDETVVQRVEGATTGFYPAYWTPIQGWLGLMIGGARSVGRIVNLTEDSGKGLTDDLIYSALATFPSGRQPNLIVMNRRSLEQLRKSRTATNPTGNPAPRPTDVDGIKIVSTDAIVSTEALVA